MVGARWGYLVRPRSLVPHRVSLYNGEMKEDTMEFAGRSLMGSENATGAPHLILPNMTTDNIGGMLVRWAAAKASLNGETNPRLD